MAARRSSPTRLSQPDLTLSNTKVILNSMKTAISIPDPIFSRAERFARCRKMSRSALFAVAVSEYLEHHGEENVTERLNEIYTQENSTLDPVLMDLQRLSLTEEQ